MTKKYIHKLTKKYHPWRELKFDELSEIYSSMAIRSIGYSLIGIFVPLYLYKSGLTLQSIFYFYVMFFIIRIPVAFVAAYVVGRIGPKHTIAISTLLFVTFLFLLLSFKSGLWPLEMLAFFFTLANGFFFIAYNTDFSKIKDKKNGGKELGWLYIFERFGGVVGPLIGGLLATFISPSVTILLAVSILIGSLVPLFLTREPVRVHQKISFKQFKYSNHIYDFISLSAFNVENTARLAMWPLLLAIVVFTEDTYAKVGAIIALSMFISMFAARMFGKFIDSSKGYYLLRYGTIMGFIVHTIRAFITTSAGAIAVTVLNEPIMLSYRMPLVNGLYDAADREEGYRIVYLAVMEMVVAVAKAIYFLALLVFAHFYDPIIVLRYSFIFIALISLMMLLQRFPILKKV